jgi:hypothetical protein
VVNVKNPDRLKESGFLQETPILDLTKKLRTTNQQKQLIILSNNSTL